MAKVSALLRRTSAAVRPPGTPNEVALRVIA